MKKITTVIILVSLALVAALCSCSQSADPMAGRRLSEKCVPVSKDVWLIRGSEFGINTKDFHSLLSEYPSREMRSVVGVGYNTTDLLVVFEPEVEK